MTMTKSIDSRFWDRISEKYFAQPIPDEAKYKRKLEVTRSYMAKDMSVLELGCGTGGTAIKHARHVAHIDATDISPKMIEIADRQASEAGIDNVTCTAGTLDTLPEWPEGHDMVLAMNVLHLLPGLGRAVDQIWDRLEPGGFFVSTTPCLGELNPVMRGALGLLSSLLEPFGRFPLLRFFKVRDLEDELVRAGFTLEYHWQPTPREAFIVARKPQPLLTSE